MAVSLIYKLEISANVRWKTVEKCYGHLFLNTPDHSLLLILWALEQTVHRIEYFEAVDTAVKLLRGNTEHMSHCIKHISLSVKSLSLVDAELLMEFVKNFETRENTRQMVRAWMSRD